MSRPEMRTQSVISLYHHLGKSRSEARLAAVDLASKLGINADKAIDDALDLYYGEQW